ncbi:prephenate dehydratase domain-containing protein [Bifidobacterium sp. ESL0784]|uniref:prephenate dehydratase domain-containing protein n=1 Tax=Bifidobacterium sp. ESL0784 TaxID=2983231 RepID=UPI0023F719C7|nr:prephenate dehydratase domain-containing protein [Bifidobacterium sp. ESL0784]MDF7641153.1 prephenate dehydratase domain-containing protein [Bifidobacterium sp. ESL0784]
MSAFEENTNDNRTGQTKHSVPHKLFFLGPQGSFTHQAAASAAEMLGEDGQYIALVARENVPSIISDVEAGEGWGVIAWENSVEGYVVPNLDVVIDAKDLAGLSRLSVDIAFDAFVRADDGKVCDANEGEHTPLHEITAHPHGLAQCTRFAREHDLTPVPASSNAAACRDVKSGQVALGPALCGKLYGLKTLERNVQDFGGANTDFLVVAPRDDARSVLQGYRQADIADFETIIAVIPLSTGPGVIAKLLDSVRDEGLNMTSLMSRPIKGHAGTYSFIITLDAAPWQSNFSHLLHQIVSDGDWVKTLAVYPRGEHPNPPVDTWMLPQGGICRKRLHASDVETKEERELLW